jgi:hypothetical protein
METLKVSKTARALSLWHTITTEGAEWNIDKGILSR